LLITDTIGGRRGSTPLIRDFCFLIVIKALLSAMDTEKAKQPEQPTQGNGTGKADELQDEFINTGRIGRRNALHDILDESHCETTTADLPLKLSALTTNGE
jgi:hypothetical protein